MLPVWRLQQSLLLPTSSPCFSLVLPLARVQVVADWLRNNPDSADRTRFDLLSLAEALLPVGGCASPAEDRSSCGGGAEAQQSKLEIINMGEEEAAAHQRGSGTGGPERSSASGGPERASSGGVGAGGETTAAAPAGEEGAAGVAGDGTVIEGAAGGQEQRAET